MEHTVLLIVTHAIGAVGLILFALSFQAATAKRLLLLRVLAGVAMAVHFALLGAYTAAAVNLIAAIKTFIYYRVTRRDSWAVPVIFTGILLISTSLTWQGGISLLPFAAGLISTYALWLSSSQRIRMYMLPVSFLWITHNILVMSPAAIISDIINITSIIIGLQRHRDTRTRTVQKTP